MDSVTREQVLAFRLRSHNLTERLSGSELLTALAACGIQDSPPGSAALSLHARVASLRPEDLDDALLVSKTALRVWCMRAAPYVIPSSDFAVFTTGLLPDDGASLLHLIQGSTGHLDKLGITAAEAVALTKKVLPEALAGRHLTKDALAASLASAVAPRLAAGQRAIWVTPDGWRANTYGETVVRFALSVLSLQGLICLVPGKGREATDIVLASEWIAPSPPTLAREEAAATVLRRYLHCYGPSTPAHFALWAGVSPAQACRAWSLVADELRPIGSGRSSAWVLGADFVALAEAMLAHGVRLLPPHDPYLQARDRDLLVTERDRQRLVWRTIGNPGAILLDGEIVGVWRPSKQGRALRLTARLFRTLDEGTRALLQREAESLGPFRRAESVEIRYED